MKLKLALSLILASVSVASAAAVPIVVHRDPGCGCCEQWAVQVRKQFGRQVTIIDDRQRAGFQRTQGVPAALSSCHTVLVDGMVFEGHVPIADMKRVLAQKPRGVRGLAVAGMPMGSPGMEIPGHRAEAYNVMTFGSDGQRVFARHGG
ncbi:MULTISPECIES: DUF411 domain-containing protein [unclassified Sphingobium]|uniref:DUF411 domain-containing protein n=1 Tax=unclassified Sphingobium TaxID=2611147 RepID=UPI000D15BD74|nr:MULTISPECIES: DUF411 domain-containing protein [unclassified Sphingobium]PSO10417.1 metal-binding protein [Sphingobium sp. AEW4]TWD03635.1 hypothetical protein FB595_11374 [Sphingobium sp. AEW010]TWD21162.1 hypothetical protein FB596_11351 [Sphingobium sp. AEW013]TWD23804.1 hypothetical protein FB594_11351 [Sphingobium sp. AEW001]